MTHIRASFETWRKDESLSDTEKVKATFGCSKLSCARYVLTDSMMLCFLQMMQEQAGFEAVGI